MATCHFGRLKRHSPLKMRIVKQAAHERHLPGVVAPVSQHALCLRPNLGWNGC